MENEKTQLMVARLSPKDIREKPPPKVKPKTVYRPLPQPSYPPKNGNGG